MRPVAVVLAVLAASAGCTALVGPSTEPTPSAMATEGSRAAAPDVGVTAEGVTDPRRLGAVHARLVRKFRSYEATRRLVFRGPDGRVRGRVVQRVRVAEGGRRFVARTTVSGERPGEYAAVQPSRVFSNGTTTVIPLQFGEDVETVAYPADEAPLDGPPTVLDWQLLDAVFGTLSSRVVAIERDAGTTVYVVRGGPGSVPALSAGNVTVTARITRSGFVRSVTLRYDRGDDRHWRVVQSVSYAGRNATTVTRPAWVDPALANATTPVGDG